MNKKIIPIVPGTLLSSQKHGLCTVVNSVVHKHQFTIIVKNSDGKEIHCPYTKLNKEFKEVISG